MRGKRRGGGARATVAAALLVSLVAHPTPASAWGFTAHRMVNRWAITTLPAPLKALFEGNSAYLAEHAIDPDLWRAAGKKGEDPNHYLDLDFFGAYPFAEISHDEARHLERFGEEGAKKGRVPWRVREAYQELVEAFRGTDEARVLAAAAVLGHYVGDSHVPLHASLNHDGQLTGQNGLHSRWERWLIERFERQLEAAVLPASARRLRDDPVEVTFGVLLSSWTHAQGVLASDKDVVGPRDLAATAEDDRYGDGYYSRLYEREGPRVVARLTAAAETLGSLWLTAYEEAGRPALDTSFRIAPVRGQRRLALLTVAGAPLAIVDEAVARGRMPSLAALRARGVTATLVGGSGDAMIDAASLMTGASPATHGVGRGDVVSTALRAEPLWVTAARQGLEATTLLVPQTAPSVPFDQERRFGGNFGRNLTLIGLEADGQPILLYKEGATLVSNKPPVADSAVKTLKDLDLGKSEGLTRLSAWSLEKTKADVFVSYVSVPDGPSALETVDEAIAAFQKQAGADAVVAIVTLGSTGGAGEVGAFVAAGPGVAAGAKLGRIPLVDVAPTLAALSGLEPPAGAEGTARRAALAVPVPKTADLTNR